MFFDPKTLSDDELADRIIELGKRMAWMHRMGHYDTVSQFQRMKTQCEAEQRERMSSYMYQRMLNQSPVAVETDPDLALTAKQERDAKAEQDTPKKGPRAKPLTVTRERIKPSLRPSTDT